MDVYSKMTDEELAIAYIKGDNNAFDLLLSRNQQRLYSYILFVVHDSEMAEDVFQDTFVKVIMRLQSGQYTSCGKFSAWIMRIAHNVIMDYYRDQRIESVVSTVDNEDLSQIDGRHVIVPNVESRYVNEQVYSDVRRMMNLLPPSQREVISGNVFQGNRRGHQRKHQYRSWSYALRRAQPAAHGQVQRHHSTVGLTVQRAFSLLTSGSVW